jgi:hypothetical protein
MHAQNIQYSLNTIYKNIIFLYQQNYPLFIEFFNSQVIELKSNHYLKFDTFFDQKTIIL